MRISAMTLVRVTPIVLIAAAVWLFLREPQPGVTVKPRQSEGVVAENSRSHTAQQQQDDQIDENFAPLLQQAQLADISGRVDLLEAALRRLQALAPNAIQSHYYQVYLFELKGERKDAEKALEKMQQHWPDALATRWMTRYLAVQGKERDSLQRAKLFATAGRYAEAYSLYRSLFPDGMPTLRIQLDFLALQARLDGRWPDTRQDLEALNKRYPQLPLLQLALAEHIARRYPADPYVRATYSALANGPDVGRQAAASWLRALERRPLNSVTIAEYAELASRYPSDVDIQEQYRRAKGEVAAEKIRMKNPYYRAKKEGLSLLDEEHNNAAARRLKYALQGRQNDEEVLGGLGLVYLRRGQQATAVKYFRQALANNTNPDLRSKWQNLIATSSYWAQIKEAKQYLATGQFAKAETLLLQAVDMNPNATSALISLGDLELARQAYRLADEYYQRALQLEPSNATALRARVSLRQRRFGRHHALRFIDSLNAGQQAVLATKRRELEAEQDQAALTVALKSRDNVQLREALAQALSSQPDSPWFRADIANGYVQLGEPDRGDALMAAWRNKDASAEMRFAYALYLSGRGDSAAAIKQLQAIPMAQRSEAMESNLLRLSIAQDLGEVEMAYQQAPTATVQRLREVQEVYQHDSDAMLRIAQIWLDLALPAEAVKIVDDLRPQSQWPFLRTYAYGDLLLGLQRYDQYPVLRAGIRQNQLTVEQQQQLAQQQARYQLARAEDFEAREKYLVAYSLYHQAASVAGPHQVSARLGAMRNSRRIGEEESYQAQSQALLAQHQNLWPSALMDIAQSMHDSGDDQGRDKALQILASREDASALDLRNAMLLAEDTEDWAKAERFAYLALARDAGVSTTDPKQLYQSAADNWLANSVKSHIDGFRDRRDGHIIIGFDHSVRDGREKTAQVPIEARIPVPSLEGHLLLRADYVRLNSGRIDYLDPDPLNPNNRTRIPFSESTSGYALGIGWQAQDWWADIGTTPIGFRQTALVGGVGNSGDWGDVGWRLTLSRRPELGTTLSYAGMEVPATSITGPGSEWGGVLRTGVNLGLSHDQGHALGFWSSLQFHQLTGERVEDNQRIAALGGMYWRVLAEEGRHIRLGVNLSYLQFDKNLEEFTLGHGGYYSPQNYISLSLPVRFYGRWGQKWSYLLGASISQSVNQTDAPYRLGGQASNGGGFGYALEAAIERRIGKKWYLGAAADIQRADFYEPNHFTLYLRYTFQERWQAIPTPPEPPIPYNSFD